MVMRSPPTSCAMAARSSVVATTFSFPCARASVASPTSARINPMNAVRFMMSSIACVALTYSTRRTCPTCLKRMRTVRTNREHELNRQLVAGVAKRVIDAPILTSNQTELRRSVRQDERSARVVLRRVVRKTRAVVARAGRPSPRELIVARHIHAECLLQSVRLVALAPDELAAAEEGRIDGALQRLPPIRRIHAEEGRAAA